MSDDVKETLECWHNSGGFECCDESECFEKVYTLAAAYADEHPTDDSLAVTEDWLRSVGFVQQHGWNGIWNGRLRYLRYTSGGADFTFGETILISANNKTRLDVRLLAKVLGITLLEASK